MQYLYIQDNDTLLSISKIVGGQNIDMLLSENGLSRSPNIGKQWKQKCLALLDSNPPEVNGARKSSLLNSLTGSEELFEKACLMDEDQWKIFSAFQAFEDALRIPETVVLPFSDRVVGDSATTKAIIGSAVSGSSSGRPAQNKYGNRNADNGISGGSSTASVSMTTPSRTNAYFVSDASLGTYSGSNNQSSVTGYSSTSSAQSSPVTSTMYRAVIQRLKTHNDIDPGIFNTVNISSATGLDPNTGYVPGGGGNGRYIGGGGNGRYSGGGYSGRRAGGSGGANSSSGGVGMDPANGTVSWNLPWGKIQLYSSLLDEVMDVPAYPEELETSRSASYTSMPDTIYQYEPWIVYQSSGPREQTISFHLHRDMWTGNHLDGRAAELISFCKANTFPRYSGSAVLSPTFKVYMNGQTFISGVLTNSTVHWSGPLGQDDWWLEFNLSLTFQEVSEVALNIDTVRNSGLVGG